MLRWADGLEPSGKQGVGATVGGGALCRGIKILNVIKYRGLGNFALSVSRRYYVGITSAPLAGVARSHPRFGACVRKCYGKFKTGRRDVAAAVRAA